jgi:tRNA wybutosine-synthesizing protein 2
MITPVDEIKKLLSKKIPSELISYPPDKWEKIGDVAIIKLHEKVEKHKELIGEVFSNVLKCKTVLWDKGGIRGEFREPVTEIIYGSNDCVTVHKENNIRFKLDPRKIMFSSGNMDERRRMAKISNNEEVVVDLFAGIGYFTLPIAVYCRPKKVFACEINPVAFDYLCQNVVLNDVTDVVKPLKGDNRKIAPRNVADRVILGYFGGTHNFLSTAVECLKNHTGIIHYHDVFSDDVVPDKVLQQVNEIVKNYNRKTELLKCKHVKSYAPGVSHFVFDIKIG